MIRFVVAASIVLAAPGAALAADLPSKVVEPDFAPSPEIPVFTWTGFEAGAQVGYDFGREFSVLRAPVLGTSAFASTPNGVIGGAHAGYNLQFSPIGGAGVAVVGVEGDIDGADYQRTRTFGGLLAGTTASTQSDIKGSIRARIGFGINRVLFYATGGAAIADFTTRYNSTAMFGAGAFDGFDRTRVGYTVGGGVEYAFMNYLSVRAEYRYTDYGTVTDQLGAAAPGLGASISHRETDNRLQAGLSYKFDSILPSPLPNR